MRVKGIIRCSFALHHQKWAPFGEEVRQSAKGRSLNLANQILSLRTITHPSCHRSPGSPSHLRYRRTRSHDRRRCLEIRSLGRPRFPRTRSLVPHQCLEITCNYPLVQDRLSREVFLHHVPCLPNSLIYPISRPHQQNTTATTRPSSPSLSSGSRPWE